jgi:cobalamin biosynthesis Mg chelatase CobN
LIPGEPLGAVEMTLVVTSGARPDLSVEATDTVDIGNPSVTLYLHNRPTPPTADTTAQANMTMTEVAPTATRQAATRQAGTGAGSGAPTPTTKTTKPCRGAWRPTTRVEESNGASSVPMYLVVSILALTLLAAGCGGAELRVRRDTGGLDDDHGTLEASHPLSSP